MWRHNENHNFKFNWRKLISLHLGFVTSRQSYLVKACAGGPAEAKQANSHTIGGTRFLRRQWSTEFRKTLENFVLFSFPLLQGLSHYNG